MLHPLADDIWTMEGERLHGVLPLRMTVIRLPGGDLLLHSPTAYRPGLGETLGRLGPIRFLVAPNSAHWMFLPAWRSACPRAEIWAAPGLAARRPVRRAGLRIAHELANPPPPCWGGAITLTLVPGILGFREVALFHVPSRSLVLTDLVVNLDPRSLPVPFRLFARAVGMTAPNGRAPAYLRAIIRLAGAPAAHAAAALVALAPQRVVFAHGAIFTKDATAALARSLAWLLPRAPAA